MSKKDSAVLRVLIGVWLSAMAALVASYGFAGSAIRTAIPLWFIGLLYAISRRYGVTAGVVSSLLCALIFACVLFTPKGTWRVADVAARTNLMWMVVGGIAFSYLFTPAGSEPKSR